MGVYVVLSLVSIGWLIYEVGLVYRDRKVGQGGTAIDRGTRYLNFISMTLGLSGAALAPRLSGLNFPGGWTPPLFGVGIGLMGLGFVLRLWAVRTLGNSFRTTVETHVGQRVITAGPYKRIRHPSYSGLLLMCLGYGVAVQNWLSLALVVGLPLCALVYRIHIEEKALLASLGAEYADYRRRTKKLIPWVW